MATPYVAYSASAGQRDFDVPFPYINRSHVTVLVNGTEATPVSWQSDTRLRLGFEVAGGAFVEVLRDTPIDEALVQFQDGNVLTSEDLNIAVLQTLYKQQELSAAYERSIGAAQSRIAQANGITVPAEEVFNDIVAELASAAVVDNFRDRVDEIGLNSANILDQATELIDLSALVDGIINGGVSSDVETLIQNETAARIAGDQALVESVDLIGARSGDGASFILDLNTVRVDSTETLGQRLSVISSGISGAQSDILSEQAARANADTAIAQDVSGILTRLDSAEAAIVSDRQASVTADSALATDITVVETTLAGNTASIQTISQSVNGLQARYGVVLNVNGHITGFAQNNDGQVGDFVVVADRFSVVDPNGGDPFTPFQISNGEVRIDGNLIVSGSILTDSLGVNSVTQGNSAFTAGSVSIPGGGGWTTVQSCPLNATGGDIRVDFCGAFSRFGGTNTSVLYRILRGSTVVRQGVLVNTFGQQPITIQDSETNALIGTATVPYPTTGTYSVFVVDTSAPAGNLTYSVQLASVEAGGSIESRQMGLLEFKR